MAHCCANAYFLDVSKFWYPSFEIIPKHEIENERVTFGDSFG